jgi:hypothetical protein
MLWFAVGVASFLGICAAVYIWAMNHYKPGQRRGPPS